MQTPLSPILAHLQSEPSRTWSIVLTLFGDVVVPRGGSVWLGTILSVFQAMAIGPGVIRTAMSRLTSDGWLMRERAGRNSYYALAARGTATFEAAEQRIYGCSQSGWDGRLRFAVARQAPEDEDFRRGMAAAGFAPLTAGTWLGTGSELSPGLQDRAAVMELHGPTETSRLLVARAWPLDRIASTYERFLDVFSALDRWCGADARLSDLDALVARILLIHEFRRVVLRDPLLPRELLPEDWPGHAARMVCSRVYHAVLPLSERWLDGNAQDIGGSLPPPDARLDRRLVSEATSDRVTEFS